MSIFDQKSLYVMWSPENGMQFRIGPPKLSTHYKLSLLFFRVNGCTTFHCLKNRVTHVDSTVEMTFDQVLEIIDHVSVTIAEDRRLVIDDVQNIIEKYKK